MEAPAAVEVIVESAAAVGAGDALLSPALEVVSATETYKEILYWYLVGKLFY